VSRIQILEVVSGFGIGGAEKALATRMAYLPKAFEHSVLNVRPEIDAFHPKVAFKETKVVSQRFGRILEIRRFLKNNSFDVVIVRTPLDAIRFGLFKYLYRNQEFKLIFEAHSNFLSKKPGISHIFKILLSTISRKIDLVIAVSANVSKGPLCKGQKRVEVVYLGSDCSSGLEKHSPAKPHLIFVGRLVDLKRPLWLLERIQKLSQEISLPEPTLTIVGSGPLESSVEAFIGSKELKRYVRFVGAQESVSPFFAVATHLISCSTNEGLPLTFFEAKLSGLSILATPSGGGSEIFGEEDVELNTFDEAEFESALRKILISSPPSAEERAAIRLKSSWMSSEQGAKRYYSAISRLLEN
jgi:glycosyltransferase involved in cell wall biosynthesis